MIIVVVLDPFPIYLPTRNMIKIKTLGNITIFNKGLSFNFSNRVVLHSEDHFNQYCYKRREGGRRGRVGGGGKERRRKVKGNRSIFTYINPLKTV